MCHHGAQQPAFRVHGPHAFHALGGIGCPEPNQRVSDAARPFLESAQWGRLRRITGNCVCAEHCKTGNHDMATLFLYALHGIKAESPILGALATWIDTAD